MFAGHYGVGLALKAADRSVSLGWLFVAVQLQDFLWTILNLTGIERTEIIPGVTKTSPLDFVYYPYSHGLLSALLLSVAVYFVARYAFRLRGALILAAAVMSHWLLDFLAHRPDLPLAGERSVKVGLGMWNHPAAAIIFESLIAIIGLVLYLRATNGTGFAGRFGIVLLMLVVLLFTIMGMISPAPPPGMLAVAATGLITYTLVALLARWLDGKRVPQ